MQCVKLSYSICITVLGFQFTALTLDNMGPLWHLMTWDLSHHKVSKIFVAKPVHWEVNMCSATMLHITQALG